MIYVLISLYLILFPFSVLALLIEILSKLSNEKKQQVINTPDRAQRKHSNIKRTDYTNVFSRRGEPIIKYKYDEYKNQRGLYEPVIPTKGIKLSNKDKEE